MSTDPKYEKLKEEVKMWESRYNHFTFNEKFKEWVIGLLVLIVKILIYKI